MKLYHNSFTKRIISFFVITVLVLVLFSNPQYINISNYKGLSLYQTELTTNIINCNTNRIYINLKQEDFQFLVQELGLYFGSTFAYQNIILWRQEYIEVNIDLLSQLKQNKIILDANVDKILSKMYEGTDKFKLWQISKYLAKTIEYSNKFTDIEPLSGLNGKGSCMTYSMLFYKMSTRLGLETYICYGDVNNGKITAPHAWNLVILNGQQYFYDITWYDGILSNPKYIHSNTSWGREFITIP